MANGHETRRRLRGKFVLDWGVWIAATLVAFVVRYDLDVERFAGASFLAFLAMGAAIKLVVLLVARLDLQSWSQVSFRNAGHLAVTLAVGGLLETGLLLAMGSRLDVSLAIPIVTFAAALLAMGAIRGARRALGEHQRRGGSLHRNPVVIVGAGEAGTVLAREMHRSPGMGYDPVAFVDDDPDKIGLRIDTIPVAGPIAELADVLSKTRACRIIIAIPTASGPTLKTIHAQVHEAMRRVDHAVQPPRIVPSLRDMFDGTASLRDVRDVRIEDLLGRDSVNLRDDEVGPYLRGKCILVTGAGGSIGSELARRIARLEPERLVLLGRGENSIFEILQELSTNHPDVHLVPLIADVRHERRIDAIFREHQPDVVFHAAAHKHVPLMQAQPGEAVENNVFGTRNVLDAALQYGTERFVNVSSDKAVRPTSIMGATKRLVELLVIDADRKAGADRAFTSVRFGNVLGSRGSVVPTFKRQIVAGGPVTITDERMTRYFMTIPEAASLVLHTAAMAENGMLYFLDMGEPVRIRDLAEHLVRLSGLEPGIDVEIRETGMRPGEKLFEELTYEPGSIRTEQHAKILSVGTKGNVEIPGYGSVDAFLCDLEVLLAAGDQHAILACVMEAVKERGHGRVVDALAGASGHQGNALETPESAADHGQPHGRLRAGRNVAAADTASVTS